MQEGKAKIEESALIVQEVARELRVKDCKIASIADKLIKTLFVLDGKVNEKDAVSEDSERLAEVSNSHQ